MDPPNTNCLLVSRNVYPQIAFQVDNCFQKGKKDKERIILPVFAN